METRVVRSTHHDGKGKNDCIQAYYYSDFNTLSRNEPVHQPLIVLLLPVSNPQHQRPGDPLQAVLGSGRPKHRRVRARCRTEPLREALLPEGRR